MHLLLITNSKNLILSITITEIIYCNNKNIISLICILLLINNLVISILSIKNIIKIISITISLKSVSNLK